MESKNKTIKPLLPDPLENAYFCGLINGSAQFLKDIPEIVTLLLRIFNSQTESKQFIEDIKKLLNDEEVIKALLGKAIEGYKEGIYVKNTEKILYQLGYDTIQILSFFITVVQLAKGVGNFIIFIKSAIKYIKKNGEKGIKALKKLKPNEISQLYNELASVDTKGKILKSVIRNIEDLKASLKKNNIINQYSTSSLEKLLAFSKNLNLPDEDLLGFIKVGNIKDISFTQLTKQMDNYVNIILKRGYPFKFKSLQEFKRFSNDLLNELRKIDIPIDDVRVQGSSLRKKHPTPKDIDLAVFVDDDVFNNYLKNAFKGKIKLDNKKVDIQNMSNDELLKLADDIIINRVNYNGKSDNFRKAFFDRKISSKKTNGINFVEGFRDVRIEISNKYKHLNIEDISIQTGKGKLSLKPDLKIQ